MACNHALSEDDLSEANLFGLFIILIFFLIPKLRISLESELNQVSAINFDLVQ